MENENECKPHSGVSNSVHGSLILNSSISIFHYFDRLSKSVLGFLRLPLLNRPIDVKLLRATTQ